jgi:hypothetical protein
LGSYLGAINGGARDEDAERDTCEELTREEHAHVSDGEPLEEDSADGDD